MPSTLLVLDLEATCWEAPHHRPGNMEIPEFGAVIVLLTGAAPAREFQSFVRPLRFPQLSDYCTALTSIRQEDVDAAEPFPIVFARFLEWVGDPGLVRFSSWGDYDRKQLIKDCLFHRVPYPFGPGHFNIKKYFAEQQGCEPQGMAQALKRLRLDIAGTHHRALDDVRNILRILLTITDSDLSRLPL